MRRFAALLSPVGLLFSSAIPGGRVRPATPPLAFASSTAISNAFFTDSPKVLTSPESGVISPILISFAGGDLQLGKSPARRTASARSDRFLLTFLLLLSCTGLSVPDLQWYFSFPVRQQFFLGTDFPCAVHDAIGKACRKEFMAPFFPRPSPGS